MDNETEEEEVIEPREVDFGVDFSVLEEEDGRSVLDTCWIAHDPAGWLLRCKAAEDDMPIPHAGRLTFADPDEVRVVVDESEEEFRTLRDEETIALQEWNRENEDKHLDFWTTLLFAFGFGPDQARINFVFQEETELLEQRLARRLAENDPGLTPAVRSSLVATQKAARRLQGLLGEEKLPLTAQPAWPTPHATPFPPYHSDASCEWWEKVRAPFVREAKELSHEEPILGSRVEKLDKHLERKGLKLLDRVRGLLPSLRMLKQEQLVDLLGQLREAGHEEIARSLHREWLGPTKASLLAKTSRDKQPPPAPIKELLDAALPNLEEAGKVKMIEKGELEKMRKRLKLVEHVLSNLTE